MLCCMFVTHGGAVKPTYTNPISRKCEEGPENSHNMPNSQTLHLLTMTTKITSNEWKKTNMICIVLGMLGDPVARLIPKNTMIKKH